MASDADFIRTFFTSLGTPDEMLERAAAGCARLRVNSHIHLPPNFSAFDTVAQAVSLAAAQDVRVVGVSNYYDFTVYTDFARRAAAAGLFPLFGIEIIALLDDLLRAGVRVNDPGNPGKMYICGKGISRFSPLGREAAALLQVIRDKDSARMAAMVERLARLCAAAGLDLGLDEAAVVDGVVRRHGCPRETVYLQERHVAQAFEEAIARMVPASERAAALERLYGVPSTAPHDPGTVQAEIRSHLMKAGKPAYTEETFVGFEHAMCLILALGGIPCYPVVADGARPICPFEEDVGALVSEMAARNLHCVEFIPNRNRPEVLLRYARALRDAGVAVTAGTEHNTPELLPIEPRCAGGAPVPEEAAALFWEGACVVAAHQFLRFAGRAGYVDDTGRPDPAHRTPHERIAAYAALGSAVIAAAMERGPAA
ncbi:MAG TPA: hypothetical protein VLH79_05840 [Chthonomonadales bacterium]|nr:hypothetical protein [Chthonomonadales bacterium]